MNMRRMGLILAFVVVVAGVFVQEAGAQGIALVSRELARADSVSGARIEVKVTDTAAGSIRNADHNPERTSVVVYRVMLFSDNSQDGRKNAQAVETQFAEIYPDIAVEVSYESPWFKVTAGYFVDRTDAVALCGRVRALAQFPKARIVQQEDSIDNIVAREKNVQKDEIKQ